MIPLPGFAETWLLSASFDGGQVFTNTVPLQGIYHNSLF
jgi:hypothetical protein